MEKQFMYMTSCYGKGEIKKVEIVKETAKQVVCLLESWGGGVRERRCAKNGNYENFFSTFAEARDFLVDKEEKKISYAKERIHEAKSALGTIKAMKAT